MLPEARHASIVLVAELGIDVPVILRRSRGILLNRLGANEMLSLDLGGPLIFDIFLACTHLLVRLPSFVPKALYVGIRRPVAGLSGYKLSIMQACNSLLCACSNCPAINSMQNHSSTPVPLSPWYQMRGISKAGPGCLTHADLLRHIAIH